MLIFCIGVQNIEPILKKVHSPPIANDRKNRDCICGHLVNNLSWPHCVTWPHQTMLASSPSTDADVLEKHFSFADFSKTWELGNLWRFSNPAILNRTYMGFLSSSSLAGITIDINTASFRANRSAFIRTSLSFWTAFFAFSEAFRFF